MEKETNRMGVMPIPKLMLSMGIPLIISLVIQAFYNIVDSYFVSGLKDTAELTGASDYAMNALTLAFPMQMLMIAIGVGTGVGVNALLAKNLGMGNRQKASKVAGNGIFLGIVTYIVFLLFGLFGVDIYLKSQTSDPIVLGMGHSYLSICMIYSFGVVLYTVYEKLLQATGKAGLSMVAQVAGAITNIILDPILIFGYFGAPELGVDGAAYATVIGQCVSLVLYLLFHYLLNREIDPNPKYIIPSGGLIKDIYKIGFPAIMMQALMSFMTYGVNIIFGQVSSAVVTAYGIYYKIQQFVFFAALGLNNAIIPILSFNYGKRDKKRINQTIRVGMIYTLVVMAIGILLLEVFAKQIAGVFALSGEIQNLCVLAMRIIAVGYLFAGANMAYQGIYQAMGAGMRSLILSLLRLIIFDLPLAWVLTRLSNAEQIIWIAFPVAEGLALIFAIIMMRGIRKEAIDPIEG